MNRYDVVVVGGRVAGAATALLLARAGVRVALIDRSRPDSDIVSTHGLMRVGVAQLSRWGLLDQITEAGTPPIRSTTFHYPDGRTVLVAIRPSPGVPALYAPRRYLLDWMLVDAAAQAGVEVITQTAITALTSDENGRVTGVRAAILDESGRKTGETLDFSADVKMRRSFGVPSLPGASGQSKSAPRFK